jgi:PTH1 family peptidyl-tRNA hydrolase
LGVRQPAYVVVGLGNPGREYERNRHNVGFMAVDALAREAGLGPWVRACGALVLEGEIEGRPVVLAKPQGYMNRSGVAARALLEQFGTGPEALVVLLDDLHLPLGKIRVRRRGSAGGQHGLESVLEACGTNEIARVRLGIGEESIPEDWKEFVLADFPRERREEVERMLERARDAVKTLVVHGVERAMASYNG